MTRRALIIGLAFFASLASGGFARADGNATPPAMPARHRVFLQKYCLDCHTAADPAGKVNLEDLPFKLSELATAERWQKVLNALNSGEMPPKDETRPTPAEKANFLEDLSHIMVAARKHFSDQGGVITMRRLNRREYENTIRDLVGVRINAKGLPADTGSGGFDTVGKSLFFSSDQFEQYLAIGQQAIDEAMTAGPRPAIKREHRECEQFINKQLKKTIEKLQGEIDEANQAIRLDDPKKFGFADINRAEFIKDQAEIRLPLTKYIYEHPLAKRGCFLTLNAGTVRYSIAIDDGAPPGEYLLTVRAAAAPDTSSEPAYLEFGQGSGESFTTLGCYQITADPDEPQTLAIPISVKPSGDRTFVFRQRQSNDRKVVQRNFFRTLADNRIGPLPTVWLDWVQWQGPIVDEWPPVPYQRIFFQGDAGETTDAYARAIIERFAARMFRGKQVQPSQVDKLVELYQRRRAAGASFERALRDPLAVVLASPSFLYIIEDSALGSPRELTGVELANRLSYFLWSAPPDEELLASGSSGELLRVEVLKRQVDRMIDDPKIASFVSGFNSQWLQMERLDFFQFNPGLYPAFDHNAKIAARDELFHTFRTILREDLGLGRLLKADFVVVNDLLADYYGLDDVTGPEFRKVPVPKGSARGGLLGMAAVLAMGSDGERSSPVERGAWVMRKILHDPPPPAPANVPQLSRLDGKALPVRELLAAHREEPQCAQCHRKIDPIGFGLENFNAAGLWRDQEVVVVKTPQTAKKLKKGRIKKGALNEFAIDASGQLPDGTPFSDYFALRDALAARTNTFARGFSESLIEYALGRPFGLTDEDLILQMLAAAGPRDYSIREIIQTLVTSQTFRTK